MATFVPKRIGRGLLVVLVVTFLVAALMQFAPGSAAAVILGEGATPEAVSDLESQLGLDRPVYAQWWDWLVSAVQGDLGTSPVTNASVVSSITAALPVTLEIAGLALVFSLVLAILFALAAAPKPGGALDRGLGAATSVLLAVPAFVAAPLLVLVFGIQLKWFPVTGWVPITENLGDNLRSALLPAVSVALMEVAVFQRVLRADLGTTMREDFITAARTKGLPTWYVLLRHALRPSSFSLLTIAGLSLGRLLGGTVIVESLFALPGIGQLVATAVTSHDLVTVQGVVGFVAAAYVLINVLVDVGYAYLDPRLRLAVAS